MAAEKYPRQFFARQGLQLHVVTATTGTNLINDGVNVVTTTGDTWTLPAPRKGVMVSVLNQTTSTAGVATVNGASTSVKFGGESSTQIVLTGQNENVSLIGYSTTVYSILSYSTDVAFA